MKWFLGFILAAGLVAAAGAEEKGTLVLESVNGQPMTVEKGTLVRVAANGIAGSKFEVKLTGKGKYTTTRVVKMAGNMPVVGGDSYEYTVEATEGKVTLEVTITPPNGGKPVTVTQEITVK